MPFILSKIKDERFVRCKLNGEWRNPRPAILWCVMANSCLANMACPLSVAITLALSQVIWCVFFVPVQMQEMNNSRSMRGMSPKFSASEVGISALLFRSTLFVLKI